MDQQHHDDTIPHQDATEEVVDKQLEDTSSVGILADVPAAVAVPTNGEFNALQASHNSVLQVLRDAGLIPTA